MKEGLTSSVIFHKTGSPTIRFTRLRCSVFAEDRVMLRQLDRSVSKAEYAAAKSTSEMLGLGNKII